MTISPQQGNLQSEGQLVSQELVRVRFTGPALEDGRMDLNLFAPAMLGFYSLINEVNKTLNPKGTKIKVHVKALEKGSFESVFDVSQSLIGQAQSFLTGTGVTSIINLLTIAGFVHDSVKMSLLRFYLWCDGVAPTIQTNDAGELVATRKDGQSVTVNGPVQVLIVNASTTLTKELAAATFPLTQPGIDGMEVTVGQNPPVRLKSDDGAVLQGAPSSERETKATSRRLTIGFKKMILPFNTSNQYSAASGGFEFKARIRDEEFVRAAAGRPFSDADHFEVELETRETESGGTVLAEYEITKVYQHLPAPVQTNMDLNIGLRS